MSTLAPRPLNTDELAQVRCALRSGIEPTLREAIYLDGRWVLLDAEGAVALEGLRSAEEAQARAIELRSAEGRS